MQLEVKTRESPLLSNVQATGSETRARMRMLHFAPRVCWPLDTGAKLRNFHLARVLAKRSSVTLLAFADSEQPRDAPDFYDRVITVPRDSGYSFSKLVRGALGRTPLPILNYTTGAMKQALARALAESEFDLVQMESIHLMEYLPIIRAARHRPMVICDWHNVESELMQRYSEREDNPLRRAYASRTARKMSEFERRAMTEFDAHVVVSERDAEQLRQVNPRARIFVIENGVDVAHYFNRNAQSAVSAPTPNRILFVGSMDYHANCDAVVDFAREVWPLVHERRPELGFTIVGRDPSAAVRELASIPGVEVTGTVDDVRPFYREAAAAVVPLKTGGGSRLKILEAMAAGVPVISTRLGAEGIDVKDRENVLLAETAGEFREAITEIIDDHELRERLLKTGRALVNERYDWSTLGANLSEVHAGLINRRPVLAVSSPKTFAKPSERTIKLLAIVEATTVNAVAKNMLEFHRAAREIHDDAPDFPRVELSLVTFVRGAEPDTSNEFVAAARAQGLRVAVISERGRFDSSVIPALRRIAEEQQPDIVLTHSVKSHFLLWRAQLWKRFPWIAFHHGYTTTDRKMRLYNQLDRWSLPHASRIVTVCEAFARELADSRSVSSEKIIVQHNSIRHEPLPVAEEVQALKRELGINDNERMLLSVGRLSQEKAHIDLLRAFKILRELHSEIEVRLVIVGDGPERAKLEAVAASLGVNAQLKFAGQVRDVRPYYAAADVLANSSESEGSPYVLLEAMAAGLPIVATAVGGVPEILDDNQTGLLVPPRNPQALAHAMARLFNDPILAERLATSAAEMAATRFSPERYARSLIDVYSEIISRA
jgi:sugar transferase (PEP-CTERM/EpsH1 system associated)